MYAWVWTLKIHCLPIIPWMSAKLPNPMTQSYWFQQLDSYLFLKLCLMLAYHQTQCSSYYQPLFRLNTPNSIQPSFFRFMEFFSEGFKPTWPKHPPFWMAHLNSITPLQEASLTTQVGYLSPITTYLEFVWKFMVGTCSSLPILDLVWLFMVSTHYP